MSNRDLLKIGLEEPKQEVGKSQEMKTLMHIDVELAGVRHIIGTIR